MVSFRSLLSTPGFLCSFDAVVFRWPKRTILGAVISSRYEHILAQSSSFCSSALPEDESPKWAGGFETKTSDSSPFTRSELETSSNELPFSFSAHLSSSNEEEGVLGLRKDKYAELHYVNGKEMLDLLKARVPGVTVRQALGSWQGTLTRKAVVLVLDSLHNATDVVAFFDWAAIWPRFLHSPYTYNSYLQALVRLGEHRKAYEVFRDRMKSYRAHGYTYGILIRGFCQADELDEALQLYEELKVKKVEPSPTIYRFLLNGLCRLDRLSEAKDLFKEMETPDITLYCTMIDGLLKANEEEEAYRLFAEMSEKGLEAGAVTYSVLNHGLFKAERLFKGLHERGIKPTLVTYTAFLTGLCKTNRFDEAYKLLEEMVAAGCIPNKVTYSTFINGLCNANKVDQALSLLKDMITQECSPDSVTYTTLLSALCRVQRVDDAMQLFNEMVESGCTPNVYTYNGLLRGLCRAGRQEEAIRLLKKMIENGCEPNAATFQIEGLKTRMQN